MNIANSIEILNRNSELLIEVENKYYVLFDANKESVIEKYIDLKDKFCLVLDSTARIDSYLQEANPIAFDIIDLSEKPIVLISSGAKNISSMAMMPNSSISIRIIREGYILQIIRKYRKPLMLVETNTSDDSESIQLPMEDALEEAGIIRLEPNGRVEVIKN